MLATNLTGLDLVVSQVERLPEPDLKKHHELQGCFASSY